jgi:Sap, sulfolipid-1-addressing protein
VGHRPAHRASGKHLCTTSLRHQRHATRVSKHQRPIDAWVFTLAAISVIGNAGLGRVANIGWYVAFVLLAMSGNLLIIAMAAFFPGRSRSLLDRTLRWLQENDRPIVIVVGLVFGIWFGIKALHGFGIF